MTKATMVASYMAAHGLARACLRLHDSAARSPAGHCLSNTATSLMVCPLALMPSVVTVMTLPSRETACVCRYGFSIGASLSLARKQGMGVIVSGWLQSPGE